MELRHWIDSAEARALLNGSRTPKPPTGLRIARVAVPVAALGIVAGLWWMKAEPVPDERVASAAPAASAPAAEPSAAAVAAAPAQAASAVADAASAAVAEPASAESTLQVTAAEPAAASHPGGTAPGAKADPRKRGKAASAGGAAETTTAAAAAPSLGVVQLAVSPWGQIEVDGRAMGTSPPLTRLTLAAGTHTITVHNADFPAYTATLAVSGDNPVTLRHRFGP